jgi:acetamidase/formamidase
VQLDESDPLSNAARTRISLGEPSRPCRMPTAGFLSSAMADALAAMTTWMQHVFDVDRPTALALASPVVDLRITQVANETWGVHAVLPHGSIR